MNKDQIKDIEELFLWNQPVHACYKPIFERAVVRALPAIRKLIEENERMNEAIENLLKIIRSERSAIGQKEELV